MYSLFYISACKIFIFLVHFIQLYFIHWGQEKMVEFSMNFSMFVHVTWLVHEVAPLIFEFW